MGMFPSRICSLINFMPRGGDFKSNKKGQIDGLGGRCYPPVNPFDGGEERQIAPDANDWPEVPTKLKTLLNKGGPMSRRHLAVLILAILLASSALAGAEVKLTALTLQSGKTIDINFAKTSRAPSRAAMQATILYTNGKASGKLSYPKMEPAVLFAGDIAAFVLWAVTLDGAAENLGEVVADKKSASGSLQGYTGKKVFALT